MYGIFSNFAGSITKLQRMKKTNISFLFIVAAVLIAGCAKNVAEGPNVANQRYFEAWMKINEPDAQKTGRGIYVLSETPGTRSEVSADGFAIVNYRSKSLDGTINAYTDKETAKQLGTYDTTTYYGKTVWTTYAETMHAGILDAIIGMKVGGKKEVVIPSWLMSYSDFSTEAQYLAHSSTSYSDAIYEIEVEDFTTDIIRWQIGEISRYFDANQDIFNSKYITDTIKGHTGCYYQSLSPGIDTSYHFPIDTSIYINYTGKLLNGLVFDTTIEKVAKDNGLYNPSRSYEPVKIYMAEEYTDISMGDDESSVIGGFALTLSQMHPMEKGIGVFTSDYGYGYSGSGASIPPYAPLVFEIEIVAAPED